MEYFDFSKFMDEYDKITMYFSGIALQHYWSQFFDNYKQLIDEILTNYPDLKEEITMKTPNYREDLDMFMEKLYNTYAMKPDYEIIGTCVKFIGSENYCYIPMSIIGDSDMFEFITKEILNCYDHERRTDSESR